MRMGFSYTDRTKHIKRVIDRKAYSTSTGEFIYHTYGEAPVSYDFGDSYYNDEQELWRSRAGAFFILRRDHIKFNPVGAEDPYYEIDEIEPITHDFAQDWLEKYANEKVDVYFSIAEAGAKEAFINLRTTSGMSKGAKILAKDQNKSVNAWINDLIMNALRDGSDTLLAYKKDLEKRRAIAEKIKNNEGGH
jgi:hypothetical protein